MADRDHVALADEEAGLAHGNVLADELAGLHHDEQGLAIDFELGPLMGAVRILDGEVVQAEVTLELDQHILGRFVEADPDHPPRLGLHLLRIVDVEIGDPAAILIGGAIDDSAMGRLRWTSTLLAAH